MIKGASGYLARAVTIAIRYSCVRKQGYVQNTKSMSYKSEERQIIDYQVQQYRLFKQLALTYAIKFSGKWMLNKFSDLESSNVGESTNEKRAASWVIENLDALPEIAATSSGLKALCTYLTSQGIEDCRKCCGGNGYLMASGIASLAADYVWQTTAEGDWIILMLQTGKYVLQVLNKAKEGEKLSMAVDYIQPIRERRKPVIPKARSSQDFFDLDFLMELFKYSALMNVLEAGEEYNMKLNRAQDNTDEAWNSCSLSWINAVRSHCYCFLLFNFTQEIKEVTEPKCKKALSNVCVLFALSTMLDDSTFNLSRDQINLAKEALIQSMAILRPDATSLTDAFDIPENVLNSVIGRKDGNIYEALFESAKKSPLNQSDPFDGYHEYLRPHLDLELLKRGNSKL